MKSPRRAAVSILRAWGKGHAYAENLIERHASRNELSAADRALLNAIVLGVLRHRRLLDHWIARLRKGKLDHETRDILRVGLCQLLVLGMPEHAAVFETVQLGRARWALSGEERISGAWTSQLSVRVPAAATLHAAPLPGRDGARGFAASQARRIFSATGATCSRGAAASRSASQ